MVRSPNTFVKTRTITLSSIAILQFSAFILCLFLLPSLSRRYIVNLAIIGVISLASGWVVLLALAGRKMCTSFGGHQIGLEFLWAVSSAPVNYFSIFSCTSLLRSGLDVTSKPITGSPQTLVPSAVHTSLILVLAFVGISSLLLTMYAISLISIMLYGTTKVSRRRDIWFMELDSPQFSSLLPFSRPPASPDPSENQPENDVNAQLLRDSRRRTRRNITHREQMHMPGCSCSEKLPRVPRTSAEFRLIQQVLHGEIELAATIQSSQSLSRLSSRVFPSYRTHRRVMSAPLTARISLPTSAERIRTSFHVGFDV